MNTHAFEKKLHSLKARFGLQLFVLAAVVCTSWIVTDHANAVYILTGPEDAAIVLNEEEVQAGEMSSQLVHLSSGESGYEMKLTGQNERFARFIGIRTDRLVLVCMLLSGALCGLVGMFRVYGAEHLFRDSISRDYYFEGLMVAMIARYQPLAVVFLSLFFAALKIGAQGMELAAGVPNQIYLIIQTVVIFLMAAESGLFGALQNRVRKGKEAEKHA